MTILLLSAIFPPRHGGSGRWFWETYRRFPSKDVRICAGAHAGDKEFDREHNVDISRVNLTLPQWGLKSLQGLWGYGRIFLLLRKRIKADAVREIHAGRCLPEGWVAWMLNRAMGINYTVYVHGEDVQSAAQSRELTWMVNRVFSRAERVVANSQNSKRILVGDWNLDARLVSVLNPGVDVRRFVPAQSNHRVRESLGWGNRKVVLTVGRLQKRKGHDRMIEAIREIKSDFPNILYSIVGGGEELESLEQLVMANSLDDFVQFRGESDDGELVHCYQQCDIFVLPNREVDGDIEGFGMVLLEAQACGKAVIAGDSGATAETMRIPETGCIVDCETSGPLANALREFLLDEELCERMGAAGREWTENQFSCDSLADQAWRLFRHESLTKTG